MSKSLGSAVTNSDTNHWSTDKNLLPKSSTCSYSAIQRWSWAKHPAISSATDVSVASISQDCLEFNTFLVYRCTGWRMKSLKMNYLPCMIVCLIMKSCWRNHREGTSWTQNSWFPWSSSQWVCPPHMSILCHLIPWLSTYHLASRFMPCTGAKRQPEIAMNVWSVGIPVLPRAEDLIGALTYILRCVSQFFFWACKFLCQKSPIQTKHF